MTGLIREHPVLSIVIAALLAALVTTLAIVLVSAASDDGTPAGAPTSGLPGASDTPSAAPSASSPAAAADCGDLRVTTSVTDADGLVGALADAQPGDVIGLGSGTYAGNFEATTSGTADEPITLCGPADAVLDGGGPKEGYVFHLDGASYWRLVGFTVTNGQKGVMADSTVGSTIQGLTVRHIGDEGIHLRKNSTDNLVTGNTVSDTGLRKPKYGEGIYIGTANSNWCDISDCKPDTSDRNIVEDNTISDTTAESVDIKEGTSSGILRGNTFDGSGMVEADSWVDVKGNDWVIENNSGRNSPGDGYQVHSVVDGWGTRNVFRDNTAVVNGPGLGYALRPAGDNVVTCGNTVSSAAEGLSNVTCSG